MAGNPHIQIPGFGCTYPREFVERAATVSFALRFFSDPLKFSVESPALLLPLEAGLAQVRIGSQEVELSFQGVMIIPAGSNFVVTPKVPILKLVVLELHKPILGVAAKIYDVKDFAGSLVAPHLYVRTNWINEVCHRYIFERAIANQPGSKAAEFLEVELVKEVYYLWVKAHQKTDYRPPTFAELPDALQRALRYIEEHLLESVDLPRLAKAAGVSKATLTRQFRDILATSPMRFLWQRRLDEARVLLNSGRYNVSEVAELVGYSDPSSFSSAFQSSFGTSPSAVKNRSE
jgi:AraC-like DNA-binding protein